MNRKFWWIRIVAFGLTFVFALSIVIVFKMIAIYKAEKNPTNYLNQEIVKVKNEAREKGRGQSGFSNQKSQCWEYCRVCKCDDKSLNVRPKKVEPENSTNSKPLEITYKPRPRYTEEAKTNNVQGNVRVRVTFLANGEIGSVSEVAGLPFGLTERAIEAAKKIKFKPQTSNGRPVTVTKVVNYTFTIY